MERESKVNILFATLKPAVFVMCSERSHTHTHRVKAADHTLKHAAVK